MSKYLNKKYNYKNGVDIVIEADVLINWDIYLSIGMEDIFTYFVKEFWNKVDELKDIKNTSTDKVHVIYHGLKGSAATLGLHCLSCCFNDYLSKLQLLDKNVDNNTLAEFIFHSLDDIQTIFHLTEKEYYLKFKI